MRDTLLAIGLLGAGAGLAAGRTRGFSTWTCLLALAALGVAFGGPARGPSERIIVLVWVAIAGTAATCWLPDRLVPRAAPLALGVMCGSLAGMSQIGWNGPLILIFAAALVVTASANVLLSAKGWLLPARIAAGWLIAIAALNITLTLLPVTPGYLPDHLE